MTETDTDREPTSRLYRTHSDSAEAVFTWRPREISTALADETTFVALDTNILLAPYGVRSGSFAEIIGVLGKLAHSNRLIVPGQVAREFARNRPSKFSDLVQRFNEASSKLGNAIPRIASYPLLADRDAYQALLTAHDAASAALDNYKKAVTEAREDLIHLAANDPIQEGYRTVLRKDVIVDPRFDEDILSQEASSRARENIPPGYKDSGKEDFGLGDFVIWKTLLGAAAGSCRDLVFVTEEKKADWWHQTGGEPLIPRYELVDEYRRVSGGGTLHLARLSDLLRGDVSSTTISDVLKLEAQTLTDSSNGALLVDDGQVLLVRGNLGFAAVEPTRQTGTDAEFPGSKATVHYTATYAKSIQAFKSGDADVLHGHTSEGHGLPTAVVHAGPYEIPWSECSDSRGWFYYREHNGGRPGRAIYELAVVPRHEIDWDYFVNGVFRRGSGEII